MNETESEQFLESTRFWIQKVVVPIIVCIGVGGNSVTVVVLTRKRMRCSTNIYLTALAVADIIYLLLSLVLSFSVYKNINDIKYELYWKFYGLSHWLCDSASNASIWLTVSFTLERYIVVCHPIKGKVLCTENRAKTIIAAVGVICLLSTLSTAFEYELAVKQDCLRNCTEEELKVMHQPSERDAKRDVTEKTQLKGSQVNIGDLVTTNETGDNETCCLNKFTVYTNDTKLGRNMAYKTFMSWYSALCFIVIPLILIATFNCFLVQAVYRSHNKRRKMTTSQETVSMSNENRITIMLIGVVVLFLVCQIPTATFLIYTNFYEPEDDATDNLFRALGNIFNSFACLNAASNFVMYCILSKKYRTTFKLLFCARKVSRQETLVLSTTHYTSFNNGFRRNVSEYRTPRNLETDLHRHMTTSPEFNEHSPLKIPHDQATR